jgi:uncharacterized membrane protein
MGLYHATLDTLRMASLLAGSLIIFAGIARATLEARGPGGRGRVGRQIMDHAALGLEFFVGATILNLILNPTWIAVATTAITIALRQLITFSLGLTWGASR